jgi:hypothetical protein
MVKHSLGERFWASAWVVLGTLGAVLAALPASAQTAPTPTIGLNVGPWFDAAAQNMMVTIQGAGGTITLVMGAVVGVGVVMKLLERVSK